MGRLGKLAAASSILGFDRAPQGATERDGFGNYYFENPDNGAMAQHASDGWRAKPGLSRRNLTQAQVRDNSAPGADPAELRRKLLGVSKLPTDVSAPLYFNRQNIPFTRGAQGEMQQLSPHRNWMKRPGVVAAQQRREARMSDPRYTAAISRAYGATGDDMPQNTRAHIDRLSAANPKFKELVQAHALVDQTLQNANHAEGVDRAALLQQAQQLIAQGAG